MKTAGFTRARIGTRAGKTSFAIWRRAATSSRRNPNGHNIGKCYRCRTDIEPTVSRQWFVRITPLAKEAIAAVVTGKTPDRSSLVGSHLFRVDEQHPRLVHLPPDLVGPPDSRLDLRGVRQGDRRLRPIPTAVPTAAEQSCGRRKMSWTPGSVPVSGPSPPLDGRRRRRPSEPSIPRRFWSQDSTSSSSGSPG